MEEIYNMVVERLKSLSYDVTEQDKYAISFTIQKVENKIKSYCNIEEIPEELLQKEIDMICGEYLLDIENTVGLEGKIDMESISSISIGNIDVSFQNGNTTKDDKIQKFLETLTEGYKDLVCYRQIKW